MEILGTVVLFLCQGSRPGQFLVDEYNPNINEEVWSLFGGTETLATVPWLEDQSRQWSFYGTKFCPQIS